MIERILPERVVSAEQFGDVPGATLFPEEETLVARAVAKRRREFTTGRHCARRALGLLGVPPGPILRGDGGAPLWPSGTIGSITHCDGYRAAAVTSKRDVLSLGIDAEPYGPLPADVLDMVASPEEIAALRRLGDGSVDWDKILFSAKESIYKTWFPLTGRWLDFTEASVDIDPSGEFTATLSISDPRMGTDRLTGRWIASDGLVATAVVLPR
ncbi:4'-phosphopantetheinyl transferase [Planotetraspora thailandica]|uniref:4'-phosphopantetheinyl transferase n=1 Tax=Planotetraspora thailandica TaxID=487172 RepID=A0A8J3XZG2_9ACTN|nr:4'-phosphopantetheinyl transferase superfamily protein [Planotetraspora thailandica]GII57993.1 4'-phosphopantetheinyl transferase [Planotetraspora thailandica]